MFELKLNLSCQSLGAYLGKEESKALNKNKTLKKSKASRPEGTDGIDWGRRMFEPLRRNVFSLSCRRCHC